MPVDAESGPNPGLNGYVLFSQTSSGQGQRDRWAVGDGHWGRTGTGHRGVVGGHEQRVAGSSYDLGPLEANNSRAAAYWLDNLNEAAEDGKVLGKTGNSGARLESGGLDDGTLEIGLADRDWNRIKNIEVNLTTDGLSETGTVTLKGFVDTRLKLGSGFDLPAEDGQRYTVNLTNMKRGEVDLSEADAGVDVNLGYWSNGKGWQNSLNLKGSAFDDVVTVGSGAKLGGPWGRGAGVDIDGDGRVSGWEHRANLTGVYDGRYTMTYAKLGDGDDTYYANTQVYVGNGRFADWRGIDVVHGGAGDDTIFGGAGDDKLFGDSWRRREADTDGNDYIDGGAGNDRVVGGGGNDELYGGEGRDRVFGGTGDDKLDGGAGRDVLKGGDGDDDLRGGAGRDRLFGGDGADDFLFGAEVEDGDRDVIVDFELGVDRLVLEDGITIESFREVRGRFTLVTLDLGDGAKATVKLKGVTGVKDEGDLTGEDVPPANEAPVVQVPIGEVDVNEDAAFSFVVPADAFFDADGDPLTLSLADPSQLPDWLSFDAETGTFTSLRDPDDAEVDAGNFTVTLVATDVGGSGASVSQDVTFRLNAVNDAPVVADGVASQQFGVDQAVSFAVPDGAFFDPDSSLTYTASGLPDWLSFENGVFTGTTPSDGTGPLDIVLTADDGEFSVSTTFSVDVLGPPQISSARFVPVEGKPTEFQIELTFDQGTTPHQVAVDFDGDGVVDYSGGATPGVPVLTDGFDFEAVRPGGQPAFAAAAAVTVTDAAGQTDTASLGVRVAPMSPGVPLNGTDMADLLLGGDGNDNLTGGGGADYLDGAGGSGDLAIYLGFFTTDAEFNRVDEETIEITLGGDTDTVTRVEGFLFDDGFRTIDQLAELAPLG